MREIIIGFSKSKKKFPIASWLIRLYQWSSFSHVYIRIPSKRLGKLPSDRIVHASEGLVQHMSGTVFDKKHKAVKEYSLMVTEDVWKEIKINALHELSGEPYSISQNIGVVIVRLLKMIGIRATNPFKNGWNCSEYVAMILLMAIPEENKNIRPNLITPKDIENIMIELESKSIVIKNEENIGK